MRINDVRLLSYGQRTHPNVVAYCRDWKCTTLASRDGLKKRGRLTSLGLQRDVQKFFKGLGLPARSALLRHRISHEKLTSSICLPSDSCLTRNALEEEIANDVDYIEEAAFVAIGLVAFELIIVFTILIAKCFHEIRSKMDKSTVPTRATV